MPQHFDDVVVFDAQPLNPPPANDEERKEHVFLYPCAAVLREGGRTSYAIDGAHPGVAAVDALRERLRVLDCPLQVASDETYQVGDDGDLPGLYAFVAPASDLLEIPTRRCGRSPRGSPTHSSGPSSRARPATTSSSPRRPRCARSTGSSFLVP